MKKEMELKTPNWNKLKELNLASDVAGLLPAIVQDAMTKNVLMLGYMNEESLAVTEKTKKVTFYSRTKKRLWTKGETSGNFLHVVEMKLDCDQDALLIYVNPDGPTCHTGSDSCWNEVNSSHFGFLSKLEKIIENRRAMVDADSYVASLFQKGINKIAQKVGEEAVELIIEAKDNDQELFLEESADLLFHYLMLLHAKDVQLLDVENVLRKRHK